MKLDKNCIVLILYSYFKLIISLCATSSLLTESVMGNCSTTQIKTKTLR